MNEEFEFETFAEQPFTFETEEEMEASRRRRMPARRYVQNRPRRRVARPMPRYARSFPPRFPLRPPIPQLVWPGLWPPGYPAPPYPVEPPKPAPQPDKQPDNRPFGGGGGFGSAPPASLPEPIDSPGIEEPIGEPDSADDASEFFFGFPIPLPFIPTPVENPGGGRIKDKRAPNKSDIVAVSGVGQNQVPLHRLAADAWQAMVKAARADGLAEPLLHPTSGFRDPARQAVLWQQALKRYGSPEAARKWVAPPGSSPHQSGRAMDLYLGGRNDSSNVAQLRTLPAYRWLVGNARRFGFYPYEAEPWHWEYNPPV